MAGTRILSAWALLLSSAALAAAQDTPAPGEAEIPRLVRELGDDNFQTRERAGELLKEVGIVARPALLAAARSKDPEVRFRAAALLQQMTWFTRDDHDEVKKQLAIYNRLPPRHRIDLVITWLARSDEPAEKEAPLARRVPALVRILRFEEDAAVCRATTTALETLALLGRPSRDEAVAALSRYAPAEPRSTGDRLVRFCAAADKPEEAAGHLERAIRDERARMRTDPTLTPDMLIMLLERRHARLAAIGKTAEAGADLAEILKLDPKSPSALVQLMEWHVARSEWAALAALEKSAAALIAVDARALYAAGRAREMRNDRAGADAFQKQALGLEADREYPHYRTGDYLIRLGRLEAAEREFQLVWELAPKDDACDFSAHVLMSSALGRRGRFAEAAAAAETAVKLLAPRLEKSDERFFHLPGWTLPALRSHGMWMKLRAAEKSAGTTAVEAGAKDLLSAVVCDATTAAEFRDWLLARKRTADADAVLTRSRDFFRELVRKEELNPAPANALAWLLARAGTGLDEAYDLARKATMLAPAMARHWDTLAEVCFRRGEKARAVMFARRAVELEPADEIYREQLARFEKAAR